MEEERDEDAADDAPITTDALTARTRALVEESRQLLRRLEQLLQRDDEPAEPGASDDDDERS